MNKCNSLVELEQATFLSLIISKPSYILMPKTTITVKYCSAYFCIVVFLAMIQKMSKRWCWSICIRSIYPLASHFQNFYPLFLIYGYRLLPKFPFQRIIRIPFTMIKNILCNLFGVGINSKANIFFDVLQKVSFVEIIPMNSSIQENSGKQKF